MGRMLAIAAACVCVVSGCSGDDSSEETSSDTLCDTTCKKLADKCSGFSFLKGPTSDSSCGDCASAEAEGCGQTYQATLACPLYNECSIDTCADEKAADNECHASH